MAADRPVLFDSDSFREFLRRYAEHRRTTRAGWSLGAWARKLGLAQTASLTRVINGDRDPGEQLSRALADYFQFSPDESEYWDCLLLHDKTRPGSHVRDLVERRLAEMRRIARATQRDAAMEEPLLHIESGSLVSLQGLARFDVATELLAPHGLVPVPINGAAVLVFNVADYGRSTAGVYSEFYAALLSQVPGRGALDSGLFFVHLLCNSTALATFGRIVWGNLYDVGAVALEREPERWRATIGFGEARLELQVAPPAAEGSAEKLETQGFGKVAGRPRKFRLHTQSTRMFKAFDPERDSIEVASWPQVSGLLERAEFRPLSWELHTDLRCQVYPPHDLEADN